MLYAYLGTDERSYQDYLDGETSRMLEVTPGGIYDVRVAPGRHPGLGVPPADGRWGPAAALEPGEAVVPADLLAALPPEPGSPESDLPALPGTPDDGGEAAPDNEE